MPIGTGTTDVKFGAEHDPRPQSERDDYYRQNDAAAQRYDERLAAASAGEEALAKSMAQQQRAETMRMMREQQMLAQRDAHGMAAMAGGDPSRLRAGSYAGSQAVQQGANELAIMRAIEDQAARQQMLGVYGRRGEYTTGAMATAADLYGMAAQRDAADYTREQQEALAKQQETMGYVGLVTGATGNLFMSERDAKTGIQPARERQEDEALRRIARALEQEGARTDDRLAAASAQTPPMYTYGYRPEVAGTPGAPAGPRYGPMADELARSEIGRTMVVDTPRGRAIDTGSAAVGALGLAGRANEKADRLAAALGVQLDREPPPEWVRQAEGYR